MTWFQIPLHQGAELTSPTWKIFSERCFQRVSLYVRRRVNDREILEQIVRGARLKASADRLLALGPLIDPGAALTTRLQSTRGSTFVEKRQRINNS